MLLTELVKSPLVLDKNSVYGIVVDEFVVDLPYHLKEIGLIASTNADGTLSFDVLDVALSCVAQGIDVLLEVPFGFNMPAQDVFYTAMSAGIAISLLPPKNGNNEDYLAYSETILAYAQLWLTQPNVAKMIYPISGFFQYMIGEVFGFKTPSITTDPYIQEYFVDDFSIDIMDEIKDKLRAKVYETHGGKEGFEKLAHTIAYSLADKIKSLA